MFIQRCTNTGAGIQIDCTEKSGEF